MNNNLKIVIGVVVGFMSLITVCCVSTVAIVFIFTGNLTQVADDFFTTVHNDDIDTAYTYLSTSFQNTVSPEELQQYLDKHTLNSFQRSSWNSRSIEGNQGLLEGSVTNAADESIPVRMTFIKSGETWKIDSIQRISVGISDSDDSETLLYGCSEEHDRVILETVIAQLGQPDLSVDAIATFKEVAPDVQCIVEIESPNTQLAGPLPPELGQLTRLEYLDLESNELTGSIPPEWVNLRNLKGINLTSNNITGPISPEWTSLTNLRWLGLASNNVTGTLPPELGQLTRLEHLDLEANALTGPIPPELGQLTRLEYLNLEANALTGPIPPELGQLTRLEYLDLEANTLTGPIPSEWSNFRNLRGLDLSSNNVTGTLPPILGELTRLEYLDLEFNTLTGPIPPELGQLNRLKYLDLEFNTLTGPIPPELGQLSNIEKLWLGDNNLEGKLPSTMSELSKLTTLNIDNNNGVCAPTTLAQAPWFEPSMSCDQSPGNNDDTAWRVQVSSY